MGGCSFSLFRDFLTLYFLDFRLVQQKRNELVAHKPVLDLIGRPVVSDEPLLVDADLRRFPLCELRQVLVARRDAFRLYDLFPDQRPLGLIDGVGTILLEELLAVKLRRKLSLVLLLHVLEEALDNSAHEGFGNLKFMPANDLADDGID